MKLNLWASWFKTSLFILELDILSMLGVGKQFLTAESLRPEQQQSKQFSNSPSEVRGGECKKRSRGLSRNLPPPLLLPRERGLKCLSVLCCYAVLMLPQEEKLHIFLDMVLDAGRRGRRRRDGRGDFQKTGARKIPGIGYNFPMLHIINTFKHILYHWKENRRKNGLKSILSILVIF